MSDSLSGLTRRVHAYAFDQETSEELSHIIGESFPGHDGADVLVELTLREDPADGDGDDECEEIDALAGDEFEDGGYDDDDGDDDDGEDGEDDELQLDADLDALSRDAEDEEDDGGGVDDLGAGELPIV